MTEKRDTCLTRTGLILFSLFEERLEAEAVCVPASTPAGRGGLTAAEGGVSSTATTAPTGCLGDNGG